MHPTKPDSRTPPRGILLDIEGTTSSISFVYDVMFPYVRKHLTFEVPTNWEEPDYIAAFEAIAHDAGHESLAAWLSTHRLSRNNPLKAADVVCREVIRQMDADLKATGLKQLQGLIWQAGFESGALMAHVYDDVPPALAAWNAAGKDVRIYSSGSIQAQRLFFGHTIAGNLLSHFRGHYDTTTGPKKEADSYRKIAADFGIPPGEILFLSDIVAELDAARAAGLQTTLVIRPGNAPDQASTGQPHPQIASFSMQSPGQWSG
ncbi:MAG: acireductone synthase [Planctomycetaceae bacterium]|nr:acireductone synthase [Planctomycetaceae bacterium]